MMSKDGGEWMGAAVPGLPKSNFQVRLPFAWARIASVNAQSRPYPSRSGLLVLWPAFEGFVRGFSPTLVQITSMTGCSNATTLYLRHDNRNNLQRLNWLLGIGLRTKCRRKAGLGFRLLFEE
eukprot:4097686-Amphidinium_carterae.1